DWMALGLLVATVLLAVVYWLGVSGHFPAEFRPVKLQRGWGAFVLKGGVAAPGRAVGSAGGRGRRAVPSDAPATGAGAARLFAPILLQALPDSFVNGRRGLLVLCTGTVILAAVLWRMA